MIKALALCLLFNLAFADITCSFTPPKGWKAVSKESLPYNKTKTIGYVKKNFSLIHPSINLTYEKTPLSFEEYLRIIQKQRSDDDKVSFLDLGWLETPIGKANIAKLDRKAPGGNLSMLQAIWKVNDVVFVMTAAAGSDDFLQYSKEFLKAFKTLKIE